MSKQEPCQHPSIEDAAAEIVLLVSVDPDFADYHEPYRMAAYALGWEALDGTTWWHRVMDEIG